jgi:TPR repeat protein
MSQYMLNLEIKLATRPFQARSIREASVLYVYLLTTKCKLHIGEVAKVVLHQAPVEAEVTVNNICTYSYPFKHLQACPADAQPYTISEFLIKDIHEALLSLAGLKGWDVTPFHNLHTEIVKRRYRFSGTSGRSTKNPSKQLSATMAWRTNEYIDIGVLVKNTKEASEFFFTVTSIGISLGLFESLLGNIVWVDDKALRLFQENKRDYWEIDIESKAVKFYFARAEVGDAHGQFDLAKMYINGWIVEQDMESARLWLERSAAQGYTRATKVLQRISERHESLASLADPIMNSKK